VGNRHYRQFLKKSRSDQTQGHITGEAFKPYGSLGALIKRFHEKIIHLHVHDYDGNLDHIAIGRGDIDFPDITKALCDVQFQGSLCLEINPDREPPEAICKSRDRLQAMIDKLKNGDH